MPIYEYECKKCNIIKEILVLPCDKEPKCPKCKGIMDRLISRSTFKLKGDGWADDSYTKGIKKGINNK